MTVAGCHLCVSIELFRHQGNEESFAVVFSCTDTPIIAHLLGVWPEMKDTVSGHSDFHGIHDTTVINELRKFGGCEEEGIRSS